MAGIRPISSTPTRSPTSHAAFHEEARIDGRLGQFPDAPGGISYAVFVATIGLPCSLAITTARPAQAMTMRPAAAAVCGSSRAENRQPVALKKAAAKSQKGDGPKARTNDSLDRRRCSTGPGQVSPGRLQRSRVLASRPASTFDKAP